MAMADNDLTKEELLSRIEELEKALSDYTIREAMSDQRALLDSCEDTMLLITPDTKIIMINRAGAERLGKTPEQMQGHNVDEFMPDEVRESRRKHFENAVRDKKTVYYEDIRGGCNFETRLSPVLSADGEVMFIAIYSRDVTERKIAMTELIESEERMHRIYKTIPDPVVIYDPNTFIITSTSDSLLDLYGYKREELIGQELSTLFPEQEWAMLAEKVKRNIMTDGTTRIPLHRNRTKKGEILWVQSSGTNLLIGGQRRRLVIIHNMSEQVMLQERLIRTQRLASVGLLASGLAHEMNNLLGGLRGLADLVKTNKDMLPRLLETCRIVAERGGAISGRLTTFSKADAPGEERRINFRNTIQTVSGMLTPLVAQRHIKIEEDLYPVPVTWANEGKFFQVLINLMSNAIDSIGQDGFIKISLRYNSEANEIAIQVSDNGVGIIPENLPRLFTPFFTTKRAAAAEDSAPTHLGLGLHETMNIVQEYGGKITVDSRPGCGATFTVTVPVKTAEFPEVKSYDGAKLPPPGTSILIVDDDELIRFWLAEFLQQKNYEVIAVNNGRDGVEMSKARNFDIVFLDLLMPGPFDGVKTGELIKETLPAAKLFVMTAFRRANIPEECFKYADAIIHKPFGVDDLCRVMLERGT